jgi:hypothetical protein
VERWRRRLGWWWSRGDECEDGSGRKKRDGRRAPPLNARSTTTCPRGKGGSGGGVCRKPATARLRDDERPTSTGEGDGSTAEPDPPTLVAVGVANVIDGDVPHIR